jgi:hypothetical protein
VRFDQSGDLARFQSNLRYPFTAHPQYTAQYALEVRRDGVPLPSLPMKGPMIGFGVGSAAPLTSPTGRLPLHVNYRIDQAGRYEVRLTVHDGFRDEVVIQTEWVPFDVEPIGDDARKARVEHVLENPPTDPGLIVGDFLPSLLAMPDQQSLAGICPFIHNPANLVQQYAVYSLFLFDDSMVRDAVLQLLDERGSSESLAYFLSWCRDLFEPHAEQVIDAILRHLTLDNINNSGPNLQALAFARSGFASSMSPQSIDRVDAAVRQLSDRILAAGDPEALNALAQYAATSKFDGARGLLWRIVDETECREQALICITWLAAPEDLERLAARLGDGSREAQSLPYSLDRAYSDKATPFIEKTLGSSLDPRMRMECARVLARRNIPAAFEFFREVIQGNQADSVNAQIATIDLLAPQMTLATESGEPQPVMRDPDKRRKMVLELINQKLNQISEGDAAGPSQ